MYYCYTDLPLAQLPILHVDGKPLLDSSAISSYLAREFGMYHKPVHLTWVNFIKLLSRKFFLC